MIMTKINHLKIITDLTEELLKKIKIEAKVKVEEDKDGVFQIGIDTDDTGILIGYHGETLSALQLILGLMVYKKTDHWVRLVVNVGDYREKRQETLTQMALNSAERVISTGEPVALAYLNAGERRLIHLALQDNPDVFTESEGEADNRRLIIKPKNKASEEKAKTSE